jgi:hypothetical protein
MRRPLDAVLLLALAVVAGADSAPALIGSSAGAICPAATRAEAKSAVVSILMIIIDSLNWVLSARISVLAAAMAVLSDASSDSADFLSAAMVAP